MSSSYKEEFASIIQNKVAEMFELAVYAKNMSGSAFAELFANSEVGKAFETMDPIFALGKSSIELLSIILNEPPFEIFVNEAASPEYWAGWIYAYAQVNLKKSYRTLFIAFPYDELLLNYFPYHEMDINHIINIFKKRLTKYSSLKEARTRIGLSRHDLSLLSDVSESTIKSYESNKRDIRKAQADTVLALARALRVTVDYLIY